ncbi:MAG: HAD hydrolase-like protein [Thermoanaerobaculales bacterium]|nr:HAD hydrolase-like protein [Thermoanaerobaculales bacterium]
MRYRCLIIDHDDTAVDSTRVVHYPAHVRAMELLRPGRRPVDPDTWFEKNFDPGIISFLADELGFSKEEIAVEELVWREFTADLTPEFYPGFLDVIADFKDRGGAVVVASHSEEGVIRSHYSAATNGRPVAPDLVFGWELGPEQRKPNPYPVLETLRRLRLDPKDVLVLDDLKPGVDMAVAAGVDVAAAAWSHNIPAIRSFMEQNCIAAFDTVADFAEFIRS